MASDKEKTEVKERIHSFYKLANVRLAWEVDVNERVAEVFGVMLSETRKCSEAFGWVPTPPGGRGSIAWLVMQFGRGIFNHHSPKLSVTCAVKVISVWGRSLEMASMGIASQKLPTWA